MAQNNLFNEMIEGLNGSTLLILDIDSTLVYTHGRNQAILEAYCREHGGEHPEECAQIEQVQCRARDYGYYTAFERHGVSFANTMEEKLQSFWRSRFFSNDYLKYDEPVEGSVEFVKKLEQKGHPFVYLTGRYKTTMWEGTLQYFETHGYPFTEEQVILKPTPQEKDDDYKSRVLTELKSKHQEMVLIDNEPVILHKAIEDHPDVKLVWFDSAHSGKKQPPEGVMTINTFDFN